GGCPRAPLTPPSHVTPGLAGVPSAASLPADAADRLRASGHHAGDGVDGLRCARRYDPDRPPARRVARARPGTRTHRLRAAVAARGRAARLEPAVHHRDPGGGTHALRAVPRVG